MPRYFTTELFRFLRDLEAHNDREWFADNRARYVDHVQEPALEFIADFGPRLRQISPHFRADAKVQGGSLFRIHRDTRFSSDKTPYKLNTGMHFRHERARDAHAPGYYLHLQPGECFMGVGLWHPESKVAYRIRESIADNPGVWTGAVRGPAFSNTFSLGGDSLARPPKGFDPDDPLIEDLKRKDFIASRRLTQAQVTGQSFMDDFESDCIAATPFMSFLCEAVEVEF